MSVGEQADHQTLDKILLADNDLGQFRKQRMRECARLLDGFVNRRNSRVHVFQFYEQMDKNPAGAFKPQAFAAARGGHTIRLGPGPSLLDVVRNLSL